MSIFLIILQGQLLCNTVDPKVYNSLCKEEVKRDGGDNMDKTQKILLASLSVALAFLAASAVAARPQTSSTPLYTFRMEQMSHGMNFLPSERNTFTYTAAKGHTVAYDAVQEMYCGGFDGIDYIDTSPISTCHTCYKTCKTCGETCNTCDPPACETSHYTCGHTCGYTCEKHTCWWTCNGFTTTPTCDTCFQTCAYTCPRTCQGNTCFVTCEPTCNFPTCQDTCWNTCATCEETCETCHYTCEPTCHTCWSTCSETCDTCEPTCGTCYFTCIYTCVNTCQGC